MHAAEVVIGVVDRNQAAVIPEFLMRYVSGSWP